VLALGTFAITRVLLRVSIYIPGPLLAIGAATILASTVFSGMGVALVRDKYGSIPNDFFVFTPPILPTFTASVAADALYFVVAIVFVSGVESLLCSSMADRLANNRGTPFNPDKEFWGQGLVQIITPLVNGFPCTGALARTATSIKAGAVTPLAGYFKFVLKLSLAYFLASYLERVPLACIAGILLWVATNMVKKQEISEIVRHSGGFHVALMIYTAVMVPATDFLTAVLSSLVIYAVFGRFFKSPVQPNLFATPKRDPNIRAVLLRDKAEARRPAHYENDPAEHRKWLGQIRERQPQTPRRPRANGPDSIAGRRAQAGSRRRRDAPRAICPARLRRRRGVPAMNESSRAIAVRQNDSARAPARNPAMPAPPAGANPRPARGPAPPRRRLRGCSPRRLPRRRVPRYRPPRSAGNMSVTTGPRFLSSRAT
jgi:hypothetical protein